MTRGLAGHAAFAALRLGALALGALAFGALALGALAACRSKAPPAPAPAASIASVASAPSPSKRARHGDMDVTFAVVSDTHVGYGYPDDVAKLSSDPVSKPAGLEADDVALVRRVNALAGHAYPAEIGGTVATPRGLVVTGDLTEWGRKHEWTRFLAIFGPGGPLRVPLLEMPGNHDTVDNGPWIGEQVAARHGGRFYSWDWDDLHLVALGEAPDDQGFEFLARDLAGVEADVPLVLFFHRALLGPWSTDNWFDDAHKARLAATLEGRNVVAIFHGHHHATGHYLWHGIDVWKPGAVKGGAHTLAVVHATDTAWSLASYDWDRDAWVGAASGGVSRKTMPPGPGRPR